MSALCGQPSTIYTAASTLAIMTADNIRNFSFGPSLPTEILQSPFQGKSVEEIHIWFNSNLDRFGTDEVMETVFVILDTRTIEDGTCLLVSALDDAKTSKSLRSDSYMVLAAEMNTVIGNDTFEGDLYGSIARSGFVLTEENFDRSVANLDYV